MQMDNELNDSHSDSDFDNDYGNIEDVLYTWEEVLENIPTYRLNYIRRNAPQQADPIEYNILDIENSSYLSLQDDPILNNNTSGDHSNN